MSRVVFTTRKRRAGAKAQCGSTRHLVEITNHEELETWLRTQPYAISKVIATRAALRVLSQVGQVYGCSAIPEEKNTALILASFIGSCAAWLDARVITIETEVLKNSANRITNAIIPVSNIAQSEVHNENSSENAIYTTYACVSIVDAINITEGSNEITSTMKSIGNATHSVIWYDNELWRSISDDAQWLEMNQSDVSVSMNALEHLINKPLWLVNTSDRISSPWPALKSRLKDKNEGWEVWTDWYDARLAGDPTYPNLSPDLNESLEVAIATIPDKIWKRAPAVLNAHIKKLIEEHEARQEILNAQEAAIQEIESVLEKQNTQNGDEARFGMGANFPPASEKLKPNFDHDKAVYEIVRSLAEEGEVRWQKAMNDARIYIVQQRNEIREFDEYDKSNWETFNAKAKKTVEVLKRGILLIVDSLGKVADVVTGGVIVLGALKIILETLIQYLGLP